MKRTSLARKTPLRSRSHIIRQLRPDDPIPDVEPHRYRDDRGYIRLRWLIGIQEYVEEREHRIVAGRPDADLDVHHLNEIKDDNRRENLLVCTKAEHARIHAEIERRRYAEQGWPQWKERGFRSEVAASKHDRRVARERDYRDRALAMADRYREGASTTDIGSEFGIAASNVSRMLRSVGVSMRPFVKRPQQVRAAEQVELFKDARLVVQSRDHMRCVICGRDTKWGGGQAHHIRPRGMGGTSATAAHQPTNLLWLCVRCHGLVEREGRAERWSYDLGYLLEHGRDLPVTHTVWYHRDRTWYELFPSGVAATTASLTRPNPDVLAYLDTRLPPLRRG